MSEFHIELTWICKACKHRNLGRYTQCQGCGKPKEDEQDIMPDDPGSQPHVIDPERLREAKAGPNWICPYCGSQERTINGECRNCGVDADNVERETVCVSSNNEPTNDTASIVPRDTDSSGDGRKGRVPRDGGNSGGSPKGRDKKGLATLVCLLVMAIGLVGLLVWYIVPHKVESDVLSISWRYDVDLERRHTLSGEGWEFRAPGSAFNKSCVSKHYGTEKCNPYKCRPHQVSYRCRPHQCNCTNQTVCKRSGNGYASCRTVRHCSTCYDTCSKTEYDTCYHECEVRKQWCAYQYYKWSVAKSEHTEGVSHNETWPTLQAVGEEQRLTKKEEYEVTFSGKEEPYVFKTKNLGEFRKYNTGDKWVIKVNRAGQVWPLEKKPVQQ